MFDQERMPFHNPPGRRLPECLLICRSWNRPPFIDYTHLENKRRSDVCRSVGTPPLGNRIMPACVDTSNYTDTRSSRDGRIITPHHHHHQQQHLSVLKHTLASNSNLHLIVISHHFQSVRRLRRVASDVPSDHIPIGIDMRLERMRIIDSGANISIFSDVLILIKITRLSWYTNGNTYNIIRRVESTENKWDQNKYADWWWHNCPKRTRMRYR